LTPFAIFSVVLWWSGILAHPHRCTRGRRSQTIHVSVYHMRPVGNVGWRPILEIVTDFQYRPVHGVCPFLPLRLQEPCTPPSDKKRWGGEGAATAAAQLHLCRRSLRQQTPLSAAPHKILRCAVPVHQRPYFGYMDSAECF
jgi:hypothetical protein